MTCFTQKFIIHLIFPIKGTSLGGLNLLFMSTSDAVWINCPHWLLVKMLAMPFCSRLFLSTSIVTVSLGDMHQWWAQNLYAYKSWGLCHCGGRGLRIRSVINPSTKETHISMQPCWNPSVAFYILFDDYLRCRIKREYCNIVPGSQ